MITHYPATTHGQAQHGWLEAKHHFSFGKYYNPNRLQFGALRVINDDTIQSGSGFDTHPHRNMEIITYVREGAITHQDSFGHSGRTSAGDVQVMSAGSGIYHSEFNFESDVTRLFQIWIEPNQLEVEPRWDSHAFPKETVENELRLLVSGDGQAPLQIYQDAFIYAGKLAATDTVQQTIQHQAYVLVAQGSIQIGGKTAHAGDGVEVQDQSEISIFAETDAEILVLDVPATASVTTKATTKKA